MNSFTEAYKVPQLKKKMWLSFLIVSIMVLLTLVPIPCISHSGTVKLVGTWGDVGKIIDICSLKALSNGSVVSLGIYPFLVASIIMQFLTLIIPKLRNIAMQGEAGSGFITKLTRYCSVVMDIIFAVLYCLGTHSLIDSRISFWLGAGIVTLTVACGSAFCSWCVELLNTKGLGNGITIILTAGIIRSIPPALVSGSIINAVAAVVIGAAFIILAVFANLGEKKLRIIFSKRTVGMKQYGMQNQAIPLRVTQAGIMPIVYSFTLTLLPAAVIAMVVPNKESAVVRGFIDFKSSSVFYIFFVLFLVFFTYFFAMIQFNPVDTSNQIKQYGGYIQGIRPGKPTAQYLINTYNNLNMADAMYMLLICAVPMLLSIIPALDGIWFLGIACAMTVGAVTESSIILSNGIKTADEQTKQTVKDARKNKYSK
ncbi:MAG: hypothetical protein LKG26_05635 [Saccharofermentans sp.]|jgi:preprotein translocase subunit SecY|nr:hypothetical protein [Mageeibacillus sp.]MCI1264475.1 hypothetical protein [Saccharofermentans sp.]MCI1275548.1 hypothetical protein [Saccharofermentans sp.]MCI1768837.1 hypothetical protein [Mageeibacillus sp.]